ncbi:MAG: ATP-binding protein [Zoogloea sp.]|uniref:PAS domain-containing hybrid sensor histidine kinase/response regulator n=1 Tax=Zoogloea sp. TaxID=49181 RepID=UPI00262AEFA7|nr:ATP-binding protein [Zoogloea sp.]MDD3329377.1 ATP-binding protein [Zoogloea sp.]
MALLVAGCLLAFAAATHWLLLAPTGDALAEARLEAAVGRAQAGAQLRLKSIEAQLLAARLAAPPADTDDADTASGLAATLAGADGAIRAVHRLDQSGQGVTLVRAPGGWRPTPPSRGTPPPWLAAALGARGEAAFGWSAPHPLPATGEAGITAFTRWPGRDGRAQVLAFELQLAPLLEPAADPSGVHGDKLVLADDSRTLTQPAHLAPSPGDPTSDIPSRGHARWLEAGRPEGEALGFAHGTETWLARFAPLEAGEHRWWIAGFARQPGFTPPTPLASAGLGALLLALVALAGLLGARLAPKAGARSHATPDEAPLAQGEATLAQQLADQQAFTRDLLDALPNPVFYKDSEARYLGCNRAFADAFGTTPEAIIGKTVLELPFVPPDVRSAHYARDLQILARRTPEDLTLRLPFADGREHDILFRVRDFGLADGRAGGLLGVLVDLSGEQDASREARCAEETSRRILESSPVAIVINRTDGPPLFANSRAAELADIDMQEFLLRPAVSWFRDPALAGQLIARLQQGKPVRDYEIEFRRASGEALWTLVSMTRIIFQGGPAQLTWVYDITSRKSAEQELRKLSVAVEQSPSMLVITRPDGIIQYANPCFCRIVGRCPDELVGTRPALLDAAGQPIDYLAGQWQALEGREVWKRECQLRRDPRSPLWVGISVSGLVDEADDGKAGISHCVWVIEDVAVHRQALDTLRHAKRLAEEAAEAKTRFLANMSHEIRTPMNAILGLARLSLDAGPDPRQRDYLEKIQTAAGSLLGIVNDILDFSKIEAGRLGIEATSFSLDQVLDRVITVIAHRAREKGLRFHVAVQPGLPRQLVGDPLRLGQVLINLMGNAAKFTEQGEIRLQIDGHDTDDGQLALGFSVSDTGIGMDASQITRLFEAFSQADSSMTRRFGGTGLGLAISRHLVELMGGRLEVDSQPDQGSRFSFTLRLDRADAPPAQPPATPTGAHVLVVDADPASRRILQHLLAELPHTSEGCSALAAARDTLLQAERGRPFDLLLLAPGPDIDAAAALARQLPPERPRLLVLTAFGDEADIPRADGRLHLPTTATSLREAIATALAPRDDATPPTAARPPQPAPLAGLRILLVEDNDINQLIARGLLEQLGATVGVAANGRLAIDALQTAGPEAFDLVLMDLQMPVMDGLEAARQLRREPRFRSLPIVAMTAHAMAEQRRQCREAGMDDHIAKPIVPEQLAETILHHTRRPPRGEPASPSPAPTPAAPGLPRVEGLDTAGGLRRCSGNLELYLRLLARFVGNQAATLAGIDAALASGHHQEAERLAHTLHGTAANLGADALRQAARALESALRDGRPGTDARDRLARECDILARGLAGTLPPPVTPPPARTEPDDDALDAAIARLVALLTSSDGAAPEAFRDIRAALTARFGLPAITKISEAIDHYDYDQALACLNAQTSSAPTSPLDRP